MTVDGYLSLLQCEGHDLHHVQNSGEVGHSIVTPSKIIEINWNDKIHFSYTWAIAHTYQELLCQGTYCCFPWRPLGDKRSHSLAPEGFHSWHVHQVSVGWSLFWYHSLTQTHKQRHDHIIYLISSDAVCSYGQETAERHSCVYLLNWSMMLYFTMISVEGLDIARRWSVTLKTMEKKHEWGLDNNLHLSWTTLICLENCYAII